MAGVVQPLRDSFKRRVTSVTSGSERQAENQRGDQQFGVSGPASDVELIQTLQSMREMLRQELG